MRNALDTCQLLDRHRLRRKIRELAKHPARGDSYRRSLDALASAIGKSQHAVQQRIAAMPAQIEYAPELPISAEAEKISGLIADHQVVVVAGDTGSGKTTQIPKMCLAAGLGRLGLIGHTQPRRLAAVSVANRIAEELHCELGRGVGYQVRFNATLSSGTYLKLMTDGILLAEIQQDRFLNKYEVLIIDEAHERSLNIDFLLGFLKQLLPRRKDLKLIITSATIDVEKFAAHFDDAPIVSISGRTYPIETQYRPLRVSKAEMTDEDLQIDAIVAALDGIVSSDRQHNRISGDVLVFLSSEREIRDTANILRKQKFADTEILPLYARLRHAEQLRVFRAHRGRRIVLATNVAENSLTLP
ncbi:MAG: AAA family ATPase, partial [Proteobacteria bacterium]|nr:AAA family ATPase [Pseudomonadota bacterium]